MKTILDPGPMPPRVRELVEYLRDNPDQPVPPGFEAEAAGLIRELSRAVLALEMLGEALAAVRPKVQA